MSVVPFPSSRTYRTTTGGIRSRLVGSGRMLSSTRSSLSTSLPQWAAEAHGELLAARDAEAFSKLSAGGNDPAALEEFVAYATSRITALGSGDMKDKWESLRTTAITRQQKILRSQQLSYGLRTKRAELEAGDISGDDYLSWLSDQRGTYSPNTEEYTALSEQIGDARKWIDLQVRALEKRHDAEMASAIESGEATLEQALSYFTERRAKLQPGDEAYAQMTAQISNIKNGIQARDFNDKVNTLYNKMIEASDKDPIGAKKGYLAGLVDLLNSARDAGAQQALTKQITDLKASIAKDEQLKSAQEVNTMMVRYFAGDGDANATKVLQFLAQKALTATDPTEAARYATLASQVQAHERQKAADALSGAGGGGAAGPGFTVAASERAMAPWEKTYKDAREAIDTKINRGITPTAADWEILRGARDNYLSVIGQAYEQGNLDTKRSMNNLERDVKSAAGSGKGYDFGDLGDKYGANLVTQIKAREQDITIPAANKDVELELQANSKYAHDITNAMSSPFVTDEDRAALKQMLAKSADRVADVVRDATSTMLGNKSGLAIGALSTAYDKYVEDAKAYGLAPKDMGQWMDALKNAANANAATIATGSNITPVEFAGLKALIERDVNEQEAAQKRLVQATAQRLPDGTIDPAWQPGGQLDESTRATRINQIFNRAAATTPGAAGSDLAAAFHAEERTQGTAPRVAGGGKGVAPLVQPDELLAAPPNAGAQPQPTPTEAGAYPMLDVGQIGGNNGLGDMGESMGNFARLTSGAYDPEGDAWSSLNREVTWTLPSFTLPDLGPEPAFLPLSGDFGRFFDGPTITRGNEDYGGPSFSLPLDLGSYGVGGGGQPASGGGGPTLTA